MDGCVRGFSFMPESKIDVLELQYIDSGELEQNWKVTRRERLREQEQRIWKEFVVNEQDVLKTLCKDDPYQFLEQLPQNQIEELLKIELQKMRLEKQEEDTNVVMDANPVEGDSVQEIADVQHSVMFAEEDEKEDCDMFHIFDDEKDDEISGPEDEVLNDSMGSPSTVRERQADLSSASLPNSPDKASSKSSENVGNMIESSIYCAKVKDLRMKLNEELIAIIASLEQRDVLNIDPEDLVKMCRRSSEFSARFNRIHLYQLQRQIHDVKRNNAISLPFAKHTQFQSQMVRVASLHQNMVQSFQVFHKSFEQTACVRESTGMLCALIDVCREATLASSAVCAPPNLTAAKELYMDDLLSTCDNLQATVVEYATKMTNYMHSTENTNTSHSKGSTKLSKGKKRSVGTWSKSGLAEADARLSMYSLDTLRCNMNNKSTTSTKDCPSSGTSKVGGVSNRGRVTDQDSGRLPRTGSKKSPRARGPLMRAPGARGTRRMSRDTDIQTMVQAVDINTCTSSHISRDVTPDPPTKRKDVTPRHSSKVTTPRYLKSKESSPTKPQITPRRSQNSTPRESQRSHMKNAKINIKSPLKIPEIKESVIPSVIKIQCTKRENKVCDIGKDSTEKVTFDSKGVKTGSDVSPRGKYQGDSSERKEWESEKVDIERRSDKERNKAIPARCEVTRIVRQLCGGDAAGSRSDRISGAKNAQLLCINGGSPRQPSTPQLLRILEESIQKKVPKPLFQRPVSPQEASRHRLVLAVPAPTTDRLLQYRTKFVQHMITSPMYANSVVGKPWEVIGRISERIIDDLLLACAKEMELPAAVQRLYNQETR